MIKYGVISGPYFSVFGLSTEKYGPEIFGHFWRNNIQTLIFIEIDQEYFSQTEEN